ncbi:MAG: efflux RND transporter periplasmic adaptor subunit [Planctomycetales bacterium]|nr:efflux RND transporter periplasmic adaptor subunit [Planctomycetales bacterium]
MGQTPMSSGNLPKSRLRSHAFLQFVICALICVGAFAYVRYNGRSGSDELPHAESSGQADQHSEHDGHDHAAHSSNQSISLSPQARANLGLRTERVSVGDYTKYIEVPGVVTAWPGQTHVAVTSPLTGVIQAINVSRGELIRSGSPLFVLRLTHQDLVNTQETFLSQLGQLDVEEKEIQRLTSISNSGAVAGKTRLVREYERDKLLAGIRAARQAMLLHGLTEQQINQIEITRTLIREVVVHAPIIHEDNSLHHESMSAGDRTAGSPSARLASLQPPVIPHPDHIDVEFLVTQLDTRRGEAVTAGQQLAQLSDYGQLLIEGHAYQRDGDALRKAADSDGSVQAVIDHSGGTTETIEGLNVVYIGNEIQRDSRSLPFYIGLENRIERSELRGNKRYVSWRFKPGHRMTVRLPVAKITNAIVVPKDAVAEEGPERYLFVENGDDFQQVPVEVLARDSVSVAIANDGQVWPGQTIATNGAHQLQMELKNQSGGAIDPHAGHNH